MKGWVSFMERSKIEGKTPLVAKAGCELVRELSEILPADRFIVDETDAYLKQFLVEDADLRDIVLHIFARWSGDGGKKNRKVPSIHFSRFVDTLTELASQCVPEENPNYEVWRVSRLIASMLTVLAEKNSEQMYLGAFPENSRSKLWEVLYNFVGHPSSDISISSINGIWSMFKAAAKTADKFKSIPVGPLYARFFVKMMKLVDGDNCAILKRTHDLSSMHNLVNHLMGNSRTEQTNYLVTQYKYSQLEKEELGVEGAAYPKLKTTIQQILAFLSASDTELFSSEAEKIMKLLLFHDTFSPSSSVEHTINIVVDESYVSVSNNTISTSAIMFDALCSFVEPMFTRGITGLNKPPLPSDAAGVYGVPESSLSSFETLWVQSAARVVQTTLDMPIEDFLPRSSILLEMRRLEFISAAGRLLMYMPSNSQLLLNILEYLFKNITRHDVHACTQTGSQSSDIVGSPIIVTPQQAIRKRAIYTLISLCQVAPEALWPHAGSIVARVREIIQSSVISESDVTLLTESLVSASSAARQFSVQAGFLQELMSNHIAQWKTPEFSKLCSDYKAFASFCFGTEESRYNTAQEEMLHQQRLAVWKILKTVESSLRRIRIPSDFSQAKQGGFLTPAGERFLDESDTLTNTNTTMRGLFMRNPGTATMQEILPLLFGICKSVHTLWREVMNGNDMEVIHLRPLLVMISEEEVQYFGCMRPTTSGDSGTGPCTALKELVNQLSPTPQSWNTERVREMRRFIFHVRIHLYKFLGECAKIQDGFFNVQVLGLIKESVVDFLPVLPSRWLEPLMRHFLVALVEHPTLPGPLQIDTQLFLRGIFVPIVDATVNRLTHDWDCMKAIKANNILDPNSKLKALESRILARTVLALVRDQDGGVETSEPTKLTSYEAVAEGATLAATTALFDVLFELLTTTKQAFVHVNDETKRVVTDEDRVKTECSECFGEALIGSGQKTVKKPELRMLMDCRLAVYQDEVTLGLSITQAVAALLTFPSVLTLNKTVLCIKNVANAISKHLLPSVATNNSGHIWPDVLWKMWQLLLQFTVEPQLYSKSAPPNSAVNPLSGSAVLNPLKEYIIGQPKKNSTVDTCSNYLNNSCNAFYEIIAAMACHIKSQSLQLKVTSSAQYSYLCPQFDECLALLTRLPYPAESEDIKVKILMNVNNIIFFCL
eukprot:GHVL01031006.1.p1 GENE.GHVL01031006.1~~GHVL01031006.1.p1  ORF type:complete len:1172 (-),score=165.25 GHVL01031006.1:777-4292(-)